MRASIPNLKCTKKLGESRRPPPEGLKVWNGHRLSPVSCDSITYNAPRQRDGVWGSRRLAEVQMDEQGAVMSIVIVAFFFFRSVVHVHQAGHVLVYLPRLILCINLFIHPLQHLLNDIFIPPPRLQINNHTLLHLQLSSALLSSHGRK